MGLLLYCRLSHSLIAIKNLCYLRCAHLRMISSLQYHRLMSHFIWCKPFIVLHILTPIKTKRYSAIASHSRHSAACLWKILKYSIDSMRLPSKIYSIHGCKWEKQTLQLVYLISLKSKSDSKRNSKQYWQVLNSTHFRNSKLLIPNLEAWSVFKILRCCNSTFFKMISRPLVFYNILLLLFACLARFKW